MRALICSSSRERMFSSTQLPRIKSNSRNPLCLLLYNNLHKKDSIFRVSTIHHNIQSTHLRWIKNRNLFRTCYGDGACSPHRKGPHRAIRDRKRTGRWIRDETWEGGQKRNRDETLELGETRDREEKELMWEISNTWEGIATTLVELGLGFGGGGEELSLRSPWPSVGFKGI